ncbi:MAG: tetratricopeptide repeat protein [Oscillospiraceae bacterium]|nr:tetratricopeptide repeat protein [Oscillospiraceae bacterium]
MGKFNYLIENNETNLDEEILNRDLVDNTRIATNLKIEKDKPKPSKRPKSENKYDDSFCEESKYISKINLVDLMKYTDAFDKNKSSLNDDTSFKPASNLIDKFQEIKKTKEMNISELAKKNQIGRYEEKINDMSIENVRKLVKLKLYTEALNICNKMIQKDDVDNNVYLYLGIIYYSMGKYEESIKYYNIGIKNDEDNYKLYNNRGTSYIEINEYVFAILDFTEAIKLKNDLPIIYENRARTYFKIEMYEESLQDIDKALSLNNNQKTRLIKGEVLCKLKKYDEALNEYNDMLKDGYKDNNIFLNMAEAHLGKKDYENAIMNAKKVLNLNSRDYKAYYILGNIYFNKNEFQSAINSYIKAVEINNSYGYAHLKLGLSYYNIDEYRKSIESLNNAENFSMKSIDLFSYRGEAYLALNQYYEAIRDFNKALEIDPSSCGTYFDRGVAYTNLKEYDEAFRDLKNSKRLMENSNNSGRYDDVITTVDKMLSDLNDIFQSKKV